MTPNPGAPQPVRKSNVTLFIIIALVGAGGCCLFGIIAAVAIPNFVRYQAKAKQSEAKVNIRSLFTAQKARYAETDAYSTEAGELGLMPGTRYTCFVTPRSYVAPLQGAVVNFDELTLDDAARPGVTGDCPACEFTAVCAGNIDTDPAFDVWSISSVDRACGKAGVPCNDVNDLDQ